MSTITPDNQIAPLTAFQSFFGTQEADPQRLVMPSDKAHNYFVAAAWVAAIGLILVIAAVAFL